MAPARPCGICTLILVTICKVYIYIYIYNTVLLLHFVIEVRGRYKRKAAHNTERLQTANTIAQLGMLPILDFSSEFSFLLVLIFINSQLNHLERYGLS